MLHNSKSLFVFVALFLKATTAICQDMKFGRVSLDELKATHCPIDSSADAYVIGEYASSKFNRAAKGISMFLEATVRIKILKKSAFDHATVVIPGRKSTIEGLKAVTYVLENGQIVQYKLEKDGIFEEKRGDNFYITKFTLPKVTEGCVIEYTYRYPTGYAVSSWTFQNTIPTLWSQYKVSILDYFTYSVNTQGYEPFVISEQTRDFQTIIDSDGNIATSTVDYKFAVQNAPAFRDESFITTSSDYVTMVTFELSRMDLPQQLSQIFSNSKYIINEQLLESESCGKAVRQTGFLDAAAEAITKQTTDAETRVRAALRFVQTNMKWNDDESMVTSGSLKKAYELHAGNSADINLMFMALLKKMDIEANPVVLSTRSHGRLLINNPQIKNFNYVVTQVKTKDSKEWLVDATEPYLDLGTLPLRCVNQVGLLLHKTDSDWIEIKPSRSLETTIIETTVDDEGLCKGKVVYSQGGVAAVDDRKLLATLTKEKFEELFKKNHPAYEFGIINCKNPDSLHLTFEVKAEITTSDGINVAGDRIYLKPLLAEGMGKNPFQKPERKYPVDFGTLTSQTYIINLTIPEGYTVEEIPKNVAFNLPENGGRFTFVTQFNGNKLQINSRLMFQKSIFYADQYDILRAFYDKVVEKQNVQIVLKKI